MAKSGLGYTKWYQRDVLLVFTSAVSSTVFSALVSSDRMTILLECLSFFSWFWFLVILITRRVYLRNRLNPQWLTRLQIIMRIIFISMILFSIGIVAGIDQEHIRDVLYH